MVRKWSPSALVEGGKGLGFLLEPVKPIGVRREAGRQDFHRHPAPKLGVLRKVDFSHPASPERFHEPVVGEPLGYFFGEVVRRGGDRSFGWDSQFGGDQCRQPPVHRCRPEVERCRVVGVAIESNRGLFDGLEAELLRHRGVRRKIFDGEVHPAEPGSQLHIGPLDIQPAGGLNARRVLSVVDTQPSADKEHDLALGHRVRFEMVQPGAEERVPSSLLGADCVGIEHAVETHGLPLGVASDRE
jgi:hypothetical protein